LITDACDQARVRFLEFFTPKHPSIEGLFSAPKGANRRRRAKVDESLGMATAEKSLDFVDLSEF
jgi:hypothetical protein